MSKPKKTTLQKLKKVISPKIEFPAALREEVVKVARDWTEHHEYSQGQARLNLEVKYPSVFIKDTPQNLLFVMITKRFGEETAHRYADDFLPLVLERTPRTVPQKPGI